MRQSLHRPPPKRGFWSINRDRNIAAERQAAAIAALPPPGGYVSKTAHAPTPPPADAKARANKA